MVRGIMRDNKLLGHSKKAMDQYHYIKDNDISQEVINKDRKIKTSKKAVDQYYYFQDNHISKTSNMYYSRVPYTHYDQIGISISTK